LEENAWLIELPFTVQSQAGNVCYCRKAAMSGRL